MCQNTYEETSSDGTGDGDQLDVSGEQVSLRLFEVERVDLRARPDFAIFANDTAGVL